MAKKGWIGVEGFVEEKDRKIGTSKIHVATPDERLALCSLRQTVASNNKTLPIH